MQACFEATLYNTTEAEASLLLACGLLWEKDGVDVWENTTLGDGDSAHELVELFVVSDGELQVSRGDSGLLVVSGGVSGELEDLGGEVLKDGGEVHWGTCTDSGTDGCLLDVSVDTSNWELESSSRRSRLGRRFGCFGFTSARHDED
jgi:hypothetical protein